MRHVLSTLAAALARAFSRFLPNPVEAALWYVGTALSRIGVVEQHRVDRTTDLAWPRIVIGIARTSAGGCGGPDIGI